MEENNNPIEELKKVNNAIRKYEVVLKTSNNPVQIERVKNELFKLRKYREQLTYVYDILEVEEELNKKDELDEYPFLKKVLFPAEEDLIADREINDIKKILGYFEREFLPILIERKMKLDFKYSLERDSFYNGFQSLVARIEDFEDELKTIKQGKYSEKSLIEIKNRRFKKRRIILLETDHFIRRLQKFSNNLIKDIEKGGFECLNKDDVLQFEEIEGNRFLEGYTVEEALKLLNSFVAEAINYLNLPEINVQE